MDTEVARIQLIDQKAASRFLARHLFDGTLALVLGAGASKPLGLPEWKELLQRAIAIATTRGVERSAVDFDNLPELEDGSDLEKAGTRLNMICKSQELDIREVISQALYRHDALAYDDLVKSSRLGALGAMLMGSRRGSVQVVLTFNYDSVLEEYLTLHGYSVNQVTRLPSDLGREDVAIYHPHGFLPSSSGSGKRTETLYITKKQKNQRMGDRTEPWGDFMRELVRSKTLLFIGVGDDTITDGQIGSILATESKTLSGRRPSGFALVERMADDEMRRELFRDQNVIPVPLPSFDDVDRFLLGVCQQAAGRLSRDGGTACS